MSTPQKKIVTRRSPKISQAFTLLALIIIVLLGIFLQKHTQQLGQIIQEKFNGQRWAIPATVYARPLELYPGLAIDGDTLEQELLLSGYRKISLPTTPGSYLRQGEQFELTTREFTFADGRQESSHLQITLFGNSISELFDKNTSTKYTLTRLDPAKIGSFLPKNNEDRIVLKRSELPELLTQTLLTIEDRDFYSHHGISPKGILRAMVTNIRARAMVAGGSTITQQLVKNFFLTSERSLKRKINEAIMAILLERRYDKDEILTAYANEIFLGQQGKRAIHGFGLASEFYFQKSPALLTPSQTALLVAIIKGPSYYNPFRHPERSLQRRNTVLQSMEQRGLLTTQEYELALAEPLVDSEKGAGGFSRFPAFLDLVKRRLHEKYNEEDLTSKGLKIQTTLAPGIQFVVEEKLTATIKELEQKTKGNTLEGAVVITDRNSGQILALAGGRNYHLGGFNHALDARRQIGSLIKPAVYLNGLENGYTLASPLEDKSITLRSGGTNWRPENYDHKEHGTILYYQGLARSYNLATLQLGLNLGIERVQETVTRLGVTTQPSPYPSFFLGSFELTPLEVARIYQTLASDGFFLPQQAINAVYDQENILLERNELQMEQRFPSEPVFLLNHALQLAVSEGTGQRLKAYLPETLTVAGKTGTTNNNRDSWFAGFTDSKVGVVWIGRDDNQSTGLTGSSGALPVWGRIMGKIESKPLTLIAPPNIGWAHVNKKNFALNTRSTADTITLPLAGYKEQKRNKEKTANGTDKVIRGVESMLDSFFGLFN